MKKFTLILFIFFLTILVGCNSDELSPLENRIREFDYYTEIVDFSRDGVSDFKLLVAYDEDSDDVAYIYYVDGVDRDKEIIFTVDGNIIYEDFIVNDYVDNGTFIGEFTGASLKLEENVQPAQVKFVSPGFHMSEIVGVDFKQEFNIVSSKDYLSDVNRVFVSTDNYIDDDIKLIEFELYNSTVRRSFFTVLLVTLVVYFLSLFSYKNLYKNILNYKLNNPKSRKYKKYPDPTKFKYISLIVLFILGFVIMFFVQNNINYKFENPEVYYKEHIEYEEFFSDEVNLRLGYIDRVDKDIAFVYKEPSHKIIGNLEIVLEGEYLHYAFVYTWGYGGYNYKVSYNYIDSIDMTVNVYESDSIGTDGIFDVIFSRKFISEN